MRPSDFRAKGYKHPYVAWLFERKPLYALALTGGVLSLGALGVSTTAAVKTIEKPATVNSPYQDSLKAGAPASLQWAQRFATTPPVGETSWTPGQTSTPTQPVAFKDCQAFGLLSPTVTATVRGADASTTTTVQTYLPGTTAAAFESYKATYGKCWKLSQEQQGTPATTVVSYPSGFFFTYGDTLVFVNSTNRDRLPALKDFYLVQAAKTLSASGCNSLTTSDADKARNIYLFPKDFKGLLRTDLISTQVALTNFPQGKVQEVQEVERRAVPEGPLAPSIPASLPAEAQVPVIPASPIGQHKPFQEQVTYQVDDPKGPGCGWSWAGLQKPLLDTNALEKHAQQVREEAQTTVDANATAYVNTRLAYSRSLISVMTAVNSWNSYVAQVKAVTARWQWLDDQRALLQPQWEQYVQDHNDWLNFDNKKANALKAYNSAVDSCNAKSKAYSEWQQKYGTLVGQPGVTYAPASFTPQEGVATAVTAGFHRAPTPGPTAPTPTVPAPTPTQAAPTSPSTPTVPSPTSSSPEVLPGPSESQTPLPVTPSPSITLPPPPEVCEAYPDKPAILSQDKPAEPQAPSLPAGVTVPYSWDQPAKTATVALD